MELMDYIKQDLDNIKRNLYVSSKTKRNRYLSDLDVLNELVFELTGKFFRYKTIHETNTFSLEVRDNLEFLSVVAREVMLGYQSINYKHFDNYADISLSDKDIDDILSEFLTFIGNPFLDIYKKLKDEKRIINKETHYEGISFYLFTQNSYYVIANKNNNSLTYIETLAHEIAHIYSFYFIKDYRKSKNTTGFSFYVETISLLIELLFYYYLIDKKLYEKTIRYHRNVLDTLMLNQYKKIYYLNRLFEKGIINVNGVSYKAISNDEINDFKGDYLYEFNSSYKSGELTSVNYIISYIESNKLLERILNGENIMNVINEFLLTLQNNDLFDEECEDGFDIEPLIRETKKRNLELIDFHMKTK